MSWRDQSGNNNHFATASTAPALNASDAKLGGKPSIVVSIGTNLTNAVAVAQPNTVYVVGYQALTAGADIFDGSPGRQGLGTNGTGFYMYAGVILASASRDTNAHAFACVFNGASSKLYVDSSASAAASGDAGSTGLSGPYFGGTFSGSGANGAILIYAGAHTPPQVSAVFAYLSTVFPGFSWS